MSCAQAILAPIYGGRDNTVSLVLIADGVVLADLSPVTRVLVELDDTTSVDSDTASPGAITWTNSQPYRGALVNAVQLKLGNEGLAVGNYPNTKITIFDQVNYLNGLQIENPIALTVVD